MQQGSAGGTRFHRTTTTNVTKRKNLSASVVPGVTAGRRASFNTWDTTAENRRVSRVLIAITVPTAPPILTHTLEKCTLATSSMLSGFSKAKWSISRREARARMFHRNFYLGPRHSAIIENILKHSFKNRWFIEFCIMKYWTFLLVTTETMFIRVPAKITSIFIFLNKPSM